MVYVTDERLKSFLDANQLARERLCLAVLTMDRRFSEVRPRHPRGGPDGGRDIQALYDLREVVFGAVGFINSANDSDEQKKRISKKFGEDLKSAIDTDIKPKFLVFFTNINFTVGEKDEFVAEAKKSGLRYCEIFDRERIRISLDSPDGLAARFQYLNIPLSEAEQASFFARWGDDFQSLLSTGFSELRSTLDRLLFWQEAEQPLLDLDVYLELDQEYEGSQIGHLRAFMNVFFKYFDGGLIRVEFGISDKAGRITNLRFPDKEQQIDPPGIDQGMCGGTWEQAVPSDNDETTELNLVGSMSSIGLEKFRFLRLSFSRDHLFIHQATFCLKHLNSAMYLPIVNRSLAHKVKGLHAYANGYKIADLSLSDLHVDESPMGEFLPGVFTTEELSDPWVRIRPTAQSSAFYFSFSRDTPRRVYTAPQIVDRLAKVESQSGEDR